MSSLTPSMLSTDLAYYLVRKGVGINQNMIAFDDYCDCNPKLFNAFAPFFGHLSRQN